MAQINIVFKLSIKIRPDDEAGVFVSQCPLLNIFSQGETEEEAKEALQEAVTLQLRALYKFDRLHQVLTRSGFTMGEMGASPDLTNYPGQFVGVMEQNAKSMEIEVPMTLVAAAAAQRSGWQLSH